MKSSIGPKNLTSGVIIIIIIKRAYQVQACILVLDLGYHLLRFPHPLHHHRLPGMLGYRLHMVRMSYISAQHNFVDSSEKSRKIVCNLLKSYVLLAIA